MAHPLDATRDEMREKERKRSSNPTDQRDDSPVKVCNCAKALIVVIVRGQKRGRTKGSQEREAPLPTRRSSVSSVASSSSPMRHRMRRHHGRSPDEMSTFPAVALDLRRPLFSSLLLTLTCRSPKELVSVPRTIADVHRRQRVVVRP